MNHDDTILHSPFTEILRTNYAPNVKEKADIVEYLNRPLEQILDLNALIAQLETRLELLKRERYSLQDHVNDHLALLSPFRRLPDDIVREIFLRCRDTCPVRSTKSAPLLLTRICKSWRTIAVETPRLWSSIHIHIPPLKAQFDNQNTLTETECAFIAQRVRGIQGWLERSGSLPISISLVISRVYGWKRHDHPDGFRLVDDYLRTIQSIIDMLLRFRHRWKAIRLSGVSPQILEHLSRVKPGDVPMLESLRIGYINTFSEERVDLNLQNLIAQAPSLHQLSLDAGDLRHNDIVKLPVRWNQITELQLRHAENQHGSISWTPSDVLTILYNVSRTIQKFCCVVRMPLGVVDYDSIRERLGIIQLPMLSRLSLTFFKGSIDPLHGWHLVHPDYDDLDSFLKPISCPALEDFTFRSTSEDLIFFPISPLERFIEQSDCSRSLKALTTDVKLSKIGFESLFRSMPSLVILNYANYTLWQRPTYVEIDPNIRPSDQHVLEALLPSVDDYDFLCPSLQHLQITGVDPENAKTALHLSRARLNSSRLRTLSVLFAGYTPEEYRRDLEELREGALVVKWVHHQKAINPQDPTDSPDGGLQVHRGYTDSADDWEDTEWMPPVRFMSAPDSITDQYGEY